MKNLEQNYISVVLVINELKENIFYKISEIHKELKEHFLNYELVLVDNSLQQLNLEKLSNKEIKYTYVQLPRKHKTQQALNAGTAIAIGDYIVEIEDISFDIDYKEIINLYKKGQEGYDFVFLTPSKSRFTSKIFYKIINKYFINTFQEDINSSLVTLSSRRGQNKVSEVGKKVINRNVAYVLSGLKSASILTNIHYKNKRSFSENLLLMFDTLIYYTDAITLMTQKIAFVFLIISGAGLVYSLIKKSFFNTVEGWASLFVLISFGFFGIFSIFSITIRYLHHILLNSINAKDYIYRKIEKK